MEQIADEAAAALSRAERRIYPRFAVDCPATVTLLSGAGMLKGRLTDLSVGGCRMVTPEPVSLGILARVEVCFDLRGYCFRIVAVTAGIRAKKSFGMRFLEMPKRRVEELASLMEEIAVDPEGPKAPPPVELLLPMKTVAVEKTQTVATVATEAAPAETPQNCEERSQAEPRDRRQHRRHGVDTRVNLTLIRGAIPMTGCIVNLSQGGCRLRTDEHFNVGIYTRVEAEFYLHGLPFRLAGVSQAIVDKNTIGIRFLDMSERKREQLTELIAEIEEM